MRSVIKSRTWAYRHGWRVDRMSIQELVLAGRADHRGDQFRSVRHERGLSRDDSSGAGYTWRRHGTPGRPAAVTTYPIHCARNPLARPFIYQWCDGRLWKGVACQLVRT
jgi:hypothetical protein